LGNSAGATLNELTFYKHNLKVWLQSSSAPKASWIV
jgi:hypothetical protein